ncbi:MAG: hypothetical protein JWN78_1628 [Bacteroidota bacterium]|nr:hypothetical protein [Bacteroidota bacterium]
MKKMIIMLLALTSVALSCKKNDSQNTTTPPTIYINYKSVNHVVTAVADPTTPTDFEGYYTVTEYPHEFGFRISKNTDPSNLENRFWIYSVEDTKFYCDTYNNLLPLTAGTDIKNLTGKWVGTGDGEYNSSGSDVGNIKAGSGDKYVGLQFTASGGGYFYGWALVNYAANALSLTVKEYAINNTLNATIKVGQKQ